MYSVYKRMNGRSNERTKGRRENKINRINKVHSETAATAEATLKVHY